jgi:hypothetical protein
MGWPPNRWGFPHVLRSIRDEDMRATNLFTRNDSLYWEEERHVNQ